MRRWRGWQLALWLALLAVLGASAARAEPLAVGSFESIELGRVAGYLEDADASWTIEDVSTPPLVDRFRPHTQDRPAFGFTHAAHWFRVEMAARGDGDRPTLLEIGFAELDDVRLYTRSADGAWTEHATGAALPAATRDVAYPTFVFRLPPARDAPVEVFVRVWSEGSVHVPIRLWDGAAFDRHVTASQLFFGGYYGILLALCLYNLFLFFGVRDPAYLFYVGYLACFGLFQASYEGHTTFFLWSGSPWWSQVAPGTFLCLSLGIGSLFVRSVLNLEKTLPAMARPAVGSAVGFTLLSLVVWIDYSLGVRILGVTGIFVVLLTVGVIFVVWRRGYPPARFLMLGWVVLVPGGVWLALGDLMIIDRSFFTEHAVKMSTAAEALILSFALADRIRLLTADKERAQEALLEAERQALAQQQEFGRRLIDAQDSERKRIALDLHDGFGQTLSFIAGRLKRLAKSEGEGPLGELSTMASDAAGELREASRNLHPHKLDRLGLVAAIEAIGAQLAEASALAVTVDAASELEDELTPAAKLHLFRIVQESLSNVARHAQAKSAEVRLSRKNGEVRLDVEDDGVGVPGDSGGLGVTSMAERARVLGGSFEIAHREGGGTRVSVAFPVE